MSFTKLASSEDRAEWLEARQHGITATDVAKLARGGKAVWSKVKAEKAGAEQYRGNEYMQWGREREPVIARWAVSRWPVEHNTTLLQCDDDPRWLATPDLIAMDGVSLVGDIKTAVWKGEPWGEVPPKYYDQLQWQMHVTGIPESVLVVEFHEDFRPVFFEPHVYNVPFDPKRVDELVEVAESFLAMGKPSAMDLYLVDWAIAKDAENAAKRAREEVEDLIRKQIGERDSFTYVGEAGSIKLTTPKPGTRLDTKRLQVDRPEVYNEFAVESKSTARLMVRPEEEAA